MKVGLEFSPIMVLVMFFSFFGLSFFMGMLIHSSFMYEDKQNLKQDSKKAWILSMTAGVGTTGWMFIYGIWGRNYRLDVYLWFWILSMTAGVGITGWMFIYGNYSSFL